MKWASPSARILLFIQDFLATSARRASSYAFERWSGLDPQAYDIDPGVRFRNTQQIELAAGIVIRTGTILDGRSTLRDKGVVLGRDSYIKERCIIDAYGGFIHARGPLGVGQNVFIHGGGGLTIGSYVIIGPNSNIVASNHAFASREYPIMLQGDRRRGISIGSNVWIGAGVSILDGSSIGDNVVIGAGTVVAACIPNNSVVRQSRDLTVEMIRFA